jgi:3-methyladenine DNA glycosylase AlkD
MVDDPGKVTKRQMESWAREFDSWDEVDGACMNLFRRTPHAWDMAVEWSSREEEFVKRAGFALLAGLALHDKKADDEAFLGTLPLIERAAGDERNFVKKGVSWALRVMGRRNRALNTACLETARRLVESDQPAARWIGRQAARELASPAVRRKLRG